MLSDYQRALKDLDKVDFLEPNNTFTLQCCGNVKRILKDYQGPLKDFHKANVLKPNNAFTLRMRGDVKRMLDDYQGALEDFDKANVFEPNNAFILRNHGNVKWVKGTQISKTSQIVYRTMITFRALVKYIKMFGQIV